MPNGDQFLTAGVERAECIRPIIETRAILFIVEPRPVGVFCGSAYLLIPGNHGSGLMHGYLQGNELLDLVAPLIDLRKPAFVIVACQYKAFGLQPVSGAVLLILKGMLYAPRGLAVCVLRDLIEFHALIDRGIVYGGPVFSFCDRMRGQAAPVIIGIFVVFYSRRRGNYGAALLPEQLRGAPGLPAGLRVVFRRIGGRGVGGDTR